jgi:serpin B
MRTLFLTLLAASALVVVWASVDAAQNASPSTAPIDARFINGANRFGVNLFGQLRQKDAAKNVFFSPLSVFVALNMTYNGAAGTTQREMAEALNLGAMTPKDAAAASSALLARLKSADPKVELLIANSLWGRQGVKFKEDFLALNGQYFGAELTSLDFANPQAKTTINNWVSKNTKEKIPSIIDSITSQHVLFLINAVYFKGQWRTQFDKNKTQPAPFHLTGSSEKQVPMMARRDSFSYFRGDKFQVVELPYGEGGTNATLVLPDAGTSLGDLLKDFTSEKWNDWTKTLRPTQGEVRIPRFKLEFTATLNDQLKALGMPSAFDSNRADFSGMRSERDVYISEVRHKAIAEVNEEGTVAAAATSVGVSATSVQVNPQQPFSFIADRPFLMAIRDRQTGAILFMGAVMEPLELK